MSTNKNPKKRKVPKLSNKVKDLFSKIESSSQFSEEEILRRYKINKEQKKD
jgi:hypothetical protein